MSFAPGGPAPARRPRWVVPLVAVLTAAGLTVSAVSTWAIWQLPTTVSTPGAAAAPRPRAASAEDPIDQAVRDILTRRGDAVRAHDQTAFLADLDPTLPALRTQQTAIYAGLAKIDFAQFSYRANGAAFNAAGHGTKQAATTYIAGVIATHQLAGYDTGPVVEPMAITFVQRDHRWWISSDRDIDEDLPAAGHAEPWDDGQVGVARGKRSLVIGQARDDATLRKVAAAVDQAVAADLKFWPAGSGKPRWSGRVVVYVPRAAREFTSLFRGSKQTADGVVAVAVPVRDHVTFGDGYGHSYGEVTGSRIIINPKYFKPKSSFFAVTLRHEVSHVAAQPVTSAGTPNWLVEGLAEYVGWRQSNPSQTFFARGVDARTASAINARSYHLKLPASSTFYFGSSAVISARYTTGFLVCAYIQHRYGEAKLKTFTARMGKAKTPAQEKAVLKSALRQTFGLTRTGLESAATSWLAQYRIRP